MAQPVTPDVEYKLLYFNQFKTNYLRCGTLASRSHDHVVVIRFCPFCDIALCLFALHAMSSLMFAQYKFTFLAVMLHVINQSFIYSPTDVLVSCLKNNIKIYIKIYIKTAPT